MNKLYFDNVVETSTVFDFKIQWIKKGQYLGASGDQYKYELLGRDEKGDSWIGTGIYNIKTSDLVDVIDIEKF